MSFFESALADSAKIGIRAQGLWARGVRERSASMPLELASLDCRTVALTDLTDAGEGSRCSRHIFVGHQPAEVLTHLPEDGRVLFLGAAAEPAVQMGRTLGSGRVTACGLVDYSRPQRDELRRKQRLLPAFELDFETAVRTAGLENGECPLLVSLHLGLFASNYVPNVDESSYKGLDPKVYFSSLGYFPKERVVAFHLWGGPESEHDRRTSKLGAEILRDSILHWWSDL